ncbi:MAG: PAS domain S-box protein, partial [Candidatus Auribacterota bacterium]|nr:PAS domain S-box protein [Candidatus Auribacterota bacterium]
MKKQDKSSKPGEMESLRRKVARLKKAAVNRKEMEEALKKSEIRYRAVVEDQTELISRFLPDFTCTFANEAYCRYFGHERGSLIGQSLRQLFPENELPRLEKQLAAMTPDAPAMVHEQKIIGARGDIRWQLWSNRAIFDKNGAVIEYQSVARDITKRRKAEKDLKKSRRILKEQKKILEQKNAALREILEQIGIEKKQIKDNVVKNVDELLIPIIRKMKNHAADNMLMYINILEKNLEELASSFGKKITRAELKLTPREIEICGLLKSGLTSKELANILHISV